MFGVILLVVVSCAAAVTSAPVDKAQVELDPMFLSAFKSLPGNTVAALEDLENRLRTMSKSMTVPSELQSSRVVEMSAAMILNHHRDKFQPKLASIFHFKKGPAKEELMEAVFKEYVADPCETVLNLHNKFKKNLLDYCGPDRLNCESSTPVGLFMDYHETCKQIAHHADKKRIFTYAKVFSHVEAVHAKRRLAALNSLH